MNTNNNTRNQFKLEEMAKVGNSKKDVKKSLLDDLEPVSPGRSSGRIAEGKRVDVAMKYRATSRWNGDRDMFVESVNIVLAPKLLENLNISKHDIGHVRIDVEYGSKNNILALSKSSVSGYKLSEYGSGKENGWGRIGFTTHGKDVDMPITNQTDYFGFCDVEWLEEGG